MGEWSDRAEKAGGKVLSRPLSEYKNYIMEGGDAEISLTK